MYTPMYVYVHTQMSLAAQAQGAKGRSRDARIKRERGGSGGHVGVNGPPTPAAKQTPDGHGLRPNYWTLVVQSAERDPVITKPVKKRESGF